MNKELAYSDIALQEGLGIVQSRSQCNTSVDFLNRVFKLPVCPANMACTIDFDLARKLAYNGYFYILHRFYDYDKIKQWIVTNDKHKIMTSISLGIQEKDYEFCEWLGHRTKCEIDYITVDVAHGYSKQVAKFIKHLQCHIELNGYPTKIIAGNVSHGEAALFLQDLGIGAVKIGIAQGDTCSTFGKTGFGRPMYSSVKDCAEKIYIPIIADGGIRCHGDIAKAIHAGADMVMVGSLFATSKESPAKPDGKFHKTYFGSASAQNKGENRHVEGFEKKIPINNKSYLDILKEMQEDLQSAISYSGGDELSYIRLAKLNLI